MNKIKVEYTGFNNKKQTVLLKPLSSIISEDEEKEMVEKADSPETPVGFLLDKIEQLIIKGFDSEEEAFNFINNTNAVVISDIFEKWSNAEKEQERNRKTENRYVFDETQPGIFYMALHKKNNTMTIGKVNTSDFDKESEFAIMEEQGYKIVYCIESNDGRVIVSMYETASRTINQNNGLRKTSFYK